ncbi:MAG: thioredoxin family protein [Victivallales bacterium]|nr:thioredoxin family protein [Victivallales bacterium]
MIKELTTESFQEFISSESKVLVDFWATWCGPCQMQGKLLHEAAEQDPVFGAKVGKVNVDNAQQLAVSLGIDAIPALIVFQKGKEVTRFVGVQDIAKLKAAIQ